jgi:hypothetical protein
VFIQSILEFRDRFTEHAGRGLAVHGAWCGVRRRAATSCMHPLHYSTTGQGGMFIVEHKSHSLPVGPGTQKCSESQNGAARSTFASFDRLAMRFEVAAACPPFWDSETFGCLAGMANGCMCPPRPPRRRSPYSLRYDGVTMEKPFASAGAELSEAYYPGLLHETRTNSIACNLYVKRPIAKGSFPTFPRPSTPFLTL